MNDQPSPKDSQYPPLPSPPSVASTNSIPAVKTKRKLSILSIVLISVGGFALVCLVAGILIAGLFTHSVNNYWKGCADEKEKLIASSRQDADTLSGLRLLSSAPNTQAIAQASGDCVDSVPSVTISKGIVTPSLSGRAAIDEINQTLNDQGYATPKWEYYGINNFTDGTCTTQANTILTDVISGQTIKVTVDGAGKDATSCVSTSGGTLYTAGLATEKITLQLTMRGSLPKS